MNIFTDIEDLVGKVSACVSGVSLALVPAELLSVGEKLFMAVLIGAFTAMGHKLFQWLWSKWKCQSKQ